MFYHPLVCNCEELYQIYDQLGDDFKEDESVLICKMDFTINQLENVHIRSCHEIKLYPKDSDKVIEYENDEYPLTDLIEFINLF